VNSGHSLFFRESASCSKFLNVKIVFNTVKNFRANSVFQGKFRVAQKSWIVRNIFNTVKIFRGNCFSRKAQIAQNYWTVKIFSIQCIQGEFTSGWSVLFGPVQCVIWTKVVTGYNDFELDQALIFYASFFVLFYNSSAICCSIDININF